jgi:hypothetical protein
MQAENTRCRCRLFSGSASCCRPRSAVMRPLDSLLWVGNRRGSLACRGARSRLRGYWYCCRDSYCCCHQTPSHRRKTARCYQENTRHRALGDPVRCNAVVLGGLVYIERDTWKSSYRLSKALRNPRSVTFVEFTPVESGLFVLARKAATPEDIAGFRSATSPWFLPFQPHGALCFNPHHRVEIVGADGTKLTFEVCFLCGNFYVDPLVADASTGGAVDLPPSWDKTLSSFFASIGMTPKTQEEYSAFYHRDANDQEAKAQD